MKRIMKIGCNTCKSEDSMEVTKIPRFGQFIRLLGFFIAAPSALGAATFGYAGIVLLGSPETGEVGAAGAGLSLFLAVASLVGGTVGYLLLTKIKVFKCASCGSILKRD
jgi:hypothetical protein